jgi:hypothetical protein
MERCHTTDEWIKKMWYLYGMEFYSAAKNEILSSVGTWMELEDILSEVSGSESQRPHVFSHMWNIDPIQIQAIL